jgi:renalase
VSRVAVVGAGISGAACARALTDAGVGAVVLDRGRAPGGRMASPRLPDGRTAPAGSGERRVDLGASYLTAQDEEFRALVDAWAARGLARPWTDGFHTADDGVLGEVKQGPLRFGSPVGLRALVEDLLVGVELRSGTTVTAVGPGPTVDGTAYDAVVLALPDPQAAPLLDAALEEERAAVHGRGWTPVVALAAGFAERTWDLDGVFVNGDPVLDWVADDGRRRGDHAPVLVAHSGAEFAAQHLADPAGAVPGLVAALRRLLDLPEPQWTRVQRWSHARPDGPREQDFHMGASGVGLCGDGWGSPKVETAWRSGTLLGRALVDRLG